MPTHTYSNTFYDISWQDVGDSIDTIDQIDSVEGLSIIATFDTSGGTKDDGTVYNTHAKITAKMNYSLGEGSVMASDMADAISQLSVISKTKSEIETSITERA